MSLKQYIIEALQQAQADAVVGWGRGMGHKGHMLLAQAVIVQAQELKATPFFFVSETMGKDDPLTPEEKLFIYKKVFPQYAGIFHAGSTLASVLTSVGQQYKNVLLVLGEDQVQPFQWLMKPDKSGNVPYQSYGLESLQIISRQQVNDPAQSEAGPRATPMREILMNPNATEEEQFAYWREAMPDALSDAEVLEFMNRAKSRLNVPKKVKEPKQKAVKQIKDKALKESVVDIVRKAKPLLKEASLEKKIQFVKLMKVALKESQQGVAEGSNAGDIKLLHSMSPDMLYVHATSDGTDVGGARFKKIDGAWTGDIVHVYPQFRRQGIATKIYDYAEDLVGKIIPSKTLKPKGKKFWDNRDNQGVAEGLTEARDSLFAFVKRHFPTWPDYVLKDFLYPQAKGIRDQAELDDFLKRNKQDFGDCKWTLTKLPITFDIFTPKTQRMLASREGGSSNPFQVPRDAERHALQSQMIQQKGVSAEPIIVAKLSNGYDLIEGWHRTIQHLKAFPQGYTGPAWVCTGATYKSESVKQGVAEEEVKEVTKQSAIKQYQDIQNYKDKPSPKQDDKEFIKVSINRPKKTNTNESFDYIDEE